MQKCLFLLSLIMLNSTYSVGQTQLEIEEIIKEKIFELNSLKEDERYDSLTTIISYFSKVDSSFERIQLKNLLDITSKYKDQRLYVRVLSGYSNHDRKNALKLLAKAYNIAEVNNYQYLKGQVLTVKGMLYREFGMYDSLTATLIEATNLLENSRMVEVVPLLHNTADLYYSIGLYDKAEEIYFEILEKKGDLSVWKFWRHKVIKNNLALIQMERGNYRKALDYLNQTLALDLEKEQMPRIEVSMGYITHLMTQCYYHLGDLSAANKYYNISYPLCYSHNMPKELLKLYNIKAEMHFNNGSIDSSLIYCNKGKEIIGNRISSASGVLQCYNIFSKIYDAMRDYRNAYYYKDKFSVLSDSLNKEYHTAKLMQILAENKYNKVASNLEYAKRANTYLTITIITTFIFIVLVAVIYLKLRKAHKILIEKDREKTELMDIVSHNLKNPIGVIKNAANMIKDSPEEKELLSEMSEIIESASNLMLESITQLLFSNQIEDSLFSLEEKEFNFIEIITQVIKNNEVLLKNKKQNLIKNFSEDDEIIIKADPDKIAAAIDNYLSNAIKYSPMGSTIRIKAGIQNEQVYFSVIDEGPGLTEHEISLAFGKFVRLSPRPTGNESSTGLGLSIVKKIIELHLGKVGIKSEKNKGSEFYFTLPILNIK